jgi:hypothetical protein
MFRVVLWINQGDVGVEDGGIGVGVGGRKLWVWVWVW